MFDNIFYRINNYLIKNYILIFIFNFGFVLLFANVGGIQDKILKNFEIFNGNRNLMIFIEILLYSIVNILLLTYSYLKYKAQKKEYSFYIKSILDTNGIDTNNKDLDYLISVSTDKLNEKIIECKNLLNEKNKIIKSFDKLNLKLAEIKEIIKNGVMELSLYIENLKNFNEEKEKIVLNIENILKIIENNINIITFDFQKVNFDNLVYIFENLKTKTQIENHLKNLQDLLNEIEIILIPLIDCEIFPEEVIKNIQIRKKQIEHEIELIKVVNTHQEKNLDNGINQIKQKEEKINQDLEKFVKNIKNNINNIQIALKNLKLEIIKIKSLNINIEKIEEILKKFSNIELQDLKKELERLFEKNNSIKIKDINE